ncbi:hypothetical protein PI125_g5028 [Phytophthora idaei]|nr:hypothetical protein PI125_g5028 [Phytophthora idaei]KAG3164665.1 hypothetical protein PI126_g5016 [Phytophthora idaei]
MQRIRATRRVSGSVADRLEAVPSKFGVNRDYGASGFVDNSNKTQTITLKHVK